MIDALFYDRKHKCQVWLSQLMHVHVVKYMVQGHGPHDAPRMIEELYVGHDKSLLGWDELITGEIGYKSDSCPKSNNYDRSLMISDLVFLGLGEDKHEVEITLPPTPPYLGDISGPPGTPE